MKASISVMVTAAIVGLIGAAPNKAMTAPITYGFSSAVSGDQALGPSHTYTAAGGPDITAISGSPLHRPAQTVGRIASVTWLGGLHRHYVRMA